jgi:hypothetical protein
MKYSIKKSSLLILFTAFLVVALTESKERSFIVSAKNKVRDYLESELIIPNPAHDSGGFLNSDDDNVYIYVLGGTHASLKLKFQVVADLYEKDRADTIMILNSTRMTEYDKDLDRNLTDNEWSVKQLTSLGVKTEHIEFIDIESGFFGTLSEARTLANLAEIKEIQNLYLVCSSYHSKRALITFSALFQDSVVDIKIHGTDEWIGLTGLFFEYGKLIMYENFLIPYNLWKQSG